MSNRPLMHPALVRQVGSYVVLATFLTFILLLGISNELGNGQHDALATSLESYKPASKSSDFGQYAYMRTISTQELDFENSRRRSRRNVIFVGDIHGMNEPLDDLLTKLRYASSTDLLIHTGDIVAKGPASKTVLAYMTSRNVTGVRGNHDQKVVEWRGWIERVLAQKGGQEWLDDMERRSKHDLKEYVKKGKGKGWKKIPDGWEFMGDHYQIASGMNENEYQYLLSLPLVLHIPDLHTFVVHAGILPLDPRRSVTSNRQPLAHIPSSNVNKDRSLSVLRHAQERAVLADVPQNRDPWVVLNMRGVLKDNSITRDGKDGEPWADLWSAIISRCDGFDYNLHLSSGEPDYEPSSSHLPCYPSTIVYGHAAGRGLDVKRWSTGLDTGCVYGRKLTALVLSSPNAPTTSADDDRGESIKFGEKGLANARLVSVDCKAP